MTHPTFQYCPTFKRCPDCGQTKSVDAFYKLKGRPATYCKPCARHRATDNRLDRKLARVAAATRHLSAHHLALVGLKRIEQP